MRKVYNLTTILCRCHEIWNPLGLSRPVMGLHYLWTKTLSNVFADNASIIIIIINAIIIIIDINISLRQRNAKLLQNSSKVFQWCTAGTN